MVKFNKILSIVGFACLVNIANAERVLNVYTTSNYIADSTIEKFQQNCKCRLALSYFGDPQEMAAKIAAGATGYDVIIGTGYAIQDLYKMGKLDTVQLPQISALTNVDPKFLHQSFDPQNAFSVPYAYTMTVAGYNKTKLDQLGIVPDTWAVFFDEKYLKKLQGHVTVFDSQRNVYAAALLYLGKDPNSTNPNDLALVRKVIEKASRYWARYDSTTYYRSLLNGDVWLAMSYSNDLFNALQDAKKAKLSYQLAGMVQKEGNMVELDNLVIPVAAKDKQLAYQFINQVLQPRSAYDLSQETGASVPNAKAVNMLSRQITNYAWIYPRHDQKVYGFTAYPPKTRILVNEVWTELKMECR